MDAVTMLRDLWRQRSAVVGVLALSVLAGILVLYAYSPPFGLQSRKYTVGVANTRVLIDTPSSQIARVSPEGSGDLGMRADLLSRIMVEGTVKANIAKMAGLHPNVLFGSSQAAAADDMATPDPPRDAAVLTTQVVTVNYSTQLPLIEVDAQAGDAATAARIARAAVRGLREYVDEQAADTQVPAARRVRVTPLGATQAETTVRGPKTVFAVIAAIFVFGMGCACILIVAALVRGWHRTTAREDTVPEDLADWLETAGVETPDARSPAPAPVSPLRREDEDEDDLRVAGTPTASRGRTPRRRRSVVAQVEVPDAQDAAPKRV